MALFSAPKEKAVKTGISQTEQNPQNFWSSNTYHLNCSFWAICMAVTGNPNILPFLNVKLFIFFVQKFVRRCNHHFSVFVSRRWSRICPTCQQSWWQEDALPDNHFLRQPSKFSVMLGTKWAFRVFLWEIHAPCICCISARLLQGHTVW